MSTSIGRRDLLKRAAAVSAGATAVVAGVGGRAEAATTPKASTGGPVASGTVVDVTGNPSLVNVLEDSAGAKPVRLRAALRHRKLRRGDRVAVSADPATGQTMTSPLFLSLDGKIQRLSDSELVIRGKTCRIDENSVLYRTGGGQRTLLGKLRHSPHVRAHTTVGVMCVDNRDDHTLTVQALFLPS